MGRESINVTIAGEAGQGLATIGELLLRSLVSCGYFLVGSQSYMSRIRGGHNTFTLRAAVDEILAPREAVDILIALNQESVDLHLEDMAQDGLILADDSLNLPEDGALAVPFDTLAEGRYINVAALGAAASLLGLDWEAVEATLEKAFGKKHPEATSKNASALNDSYGWASENGPEGFRLSAPREGPRRLALNGNEAAALGALAGGVRFCAFYPMTPSTSIALNLAARAEALGLVVEQAEDEIAAVNMAVGASFAGAPSLVTTSGGGYALMGEGVSLAAMVETPLTVIVVQRPGPATGLPTRTSQADLEFVLFSGHGEFGRAVLAPGTVEQCFHLTRRALYLAEISQGPVFVLSDQFLADSHRAVEPFDLEDGPEVFPAGEMDRETPEPYQRYQVTESGVSPRLLPGLSPRLVVADSDEHTPDGHITEDLEAAREMMNKRMRKIDLLREQVIPPEYYGRQDPEILLVCWGSSRGAVWEAVDLLLASGRNAAGMHFSQVWPLLPDQFLSRLQAADRVVAVEGNASGQLANLIRRETGFKIERLVSRYDGLPLTPEYIIEHPSLRGE